LSERPFELGQLRLVPIRNGLERHLATAPVPQLTPRPERTSFVTVSVASGQMTRVDRVQLALLDERRDPFARQRAHVTADDSVRPRSTRSRRQGTRPSSRPQPSEPLGSEPRPDPSGRDGRTQKVGRCMIRKTADLSPERHTIRKPPAAGDAPGDMLLERQQLGTAELVVDVRIQQRPGLMTRHGSPPSSSMIREWSAVAHARGPAAQ
jgi:hypothetical protein